VQKNGISPVVGVLICINTMIAAGLFINPNKLTLLAGPLGFLGYLLSALILFPLLLCIAELAKLHPVSGGLYVYSKTYINAGAGFLSGWAYFVGKTTSVALLMHKFVEFFQPKFSILASVPILALDFSLIFVLIGLNVLGMSVGGNVQYLFTLLKGVPIIFTFIMGFLFGCASCCFSTAWF
jgi:amino acid transporter